MLDTESCVKSQAWKKSSRCLCIRKPYLLPVLSLGFGKVMQHELYYYYYYWEWQFVDLLCFCSVLCLLCLCVRLFICALWSPAGKGLTSGLSFLVSTVSLLLSHWYPGSGVVLDCIDSWSLHPYLLWKNVFKSDEKWYIHNVEIVLVIVSDKSIARNILQIWKIMFWTLKYKSI